MTEGAIEKFIYTIGPGEEGNQTIPAGGEQYPLRQRSEEKPKTAEADIPSEEMYSAQMYQLLLEGKLPFSAVPLYFQKEKEEALDVVRGAVWKRPITSTLFNSNKVLKEYAEKQHAEMLALHDPQEVVRAVARIEEEYEPLINGTPHDHARYFANKAIDLSLNHRWKKPEDVTRVNTHIANLYGFASRLSREVVVEQATPAGKSTAVVATSKPEGQPVA